MPTISRLSGREILDSRGQPTVRARCVLDSGAVGEASVPSGRSTGEAEARELRDGDPARYAGLGCRRAVAAIGAEVAEALVGRAFAGQPELDHALIELDPTPQKSRLGGNTVCAVSLAFARASAADSGVPLYQHLAALRGEQPAAMPRPTINLFSGGKHAAGRLPIQDVLLVPLSATSIDECLSQVFDVYRHAARMAADRYGSPPLTADEGGLAPPFPGVEEALRGAVSAITAAGLEPGHDVALALDVAASHIVEDGHYQFGDAPLSSADMIEWISAWVAAFPIISVEDGLGEGDWSHWPQLRRELAGRAMVLGDDLLCTDVTRIGSAIDSGAADALLLKVNQVGTLTEAGQAVALAREAGWRVVASARSGETEDDWLADLAVGWGADQIKIGSITQSERLAKYNRLLEIEAETGFAIAPWAPPSAPS